MKLAKVLLTGLAIPSIALPITTLTSCGTSWGNKTPFMIGSILDGPYSEVATNYDKDGNPIDYLQNQYAIQPKTSSNYAYSIPFKFDSAQNKWTQTGEPGWYASGNEAFAMTATGSDGKEVKSVANATLSPNVDFVSSIGASLSSFINYAMQYQGQQIKKDDETNLNIAWGGAGKTKFQLDHSKNNNDFFEYIFANANINGKEKSSAQLKTSVVDFHFGDMPLPNYENTETHRIHTDFLTLIDGENRTDKPQYSTGESTEIEEDGIKFKVYTFDAVPVRLHIDKITQTYLNPSNKDDSFLVNDFYSTTEEIKKSVGGQWKNMKDFTSYSEEECVPHIRTFDLVASNAKAIASSPNYDERIGEVKGNDFIALIGYSVKIANDEDKHDKDTATISGLQNIFPAYFLDVYGESMFKKNDKGKAIVDQDKVNKGINDWLELIKRSGKSGYEIDLTKLDQEHKDLLMFLGYVFGDNTNKIDTDSLIKPIERM